MARRKQYIIRLGPVERKSADERRARSISSFYIALDLQARLLNVLVHPPLAGTADPALSHQIARSAIPTSATDGNGNRT